MVGSTIYIHFFLTKDLLFQVTLSEYIGKKYVILFFYPLDFTFVCPTGQFDVWKCQLKFDSCGHWISSFCFFFFSHSPWGMLNLFYPLPKPFCRDHCFQWPLWRVWEVKHRNIGCFYWQCGKLFSILFILWCLCPNTCDLYNFHFLHFSFWCIGNLNVSLFTW